MEFERPAGKQQWALGDLLRVGLSAEWVCPRWEAPSRGGYTSLAWPIGAQSLSQAAAPRELIQDPLWGNEKELRDGA